MIGVLHIGMNLTATATGEMGVDIVDNLFMNIACQ